MRHMQLPVQKWATLTHLRSRMNVSPAFQKKHVAKLWYMCKSTFQNDNPLHTWAHQVLDVSKKIAVWNPMPRFIIYAALFQSRVNYETQHPSYYAALKQSRVNYETQHPSWEKYPPSGSTKKCTKWAHTDTPLRWLSAPSKLWNEAFVSLLLHCSLLFLIVFS